MIFLHQKSALTSLRGMSIQSFFDPFSCHLWLSILIAYIMVSIFMFVIARVTPYERHASKNGRSNNMTLMNSFWFTLSAFFFRSTNVSPKSLSTRFLAAFWWLFCLVIVFIYVISLKNLIFSNDEDDAANHRLSIQDLLQDDSFNFVVYPQGSTHKLLEVLFSKKFPPVC